MDWQRASHRARNLAPSENHTPDILKLVFRTCHFRVEGRRSVVDELLVVKNFSQDAQYATLSHSTLLESRSALTFRS